MNTLFVCKTTTGFVVEERRGYIIKSSNSYHGAIPRLDIWRDDTSLWLFLLENNVFEVKTEEKQDKETLMLISSFIRTEVADVNSISRFREEANFIMSLIDKLELEIAGDEDVSASDYIRLSTLERLCHKRNLNLIDFFIALESDSELNFETNQSVLIETNASLYYRAIDILLNARDCSYKKLSVMTGIGHANLLSDKSDSLRGKRKTMELRTLFKITQALEVSLSVFFALCNLIRV